MGKSKQALRRDRYCEMRTLAQVRDELYRLRRSRRDNTRHLREDWEDVRWELKPANLVNRAVSRFAASSSTFGYIFSGVQTVLALFRGRREEGCL